MKVSLEGGKGEVLIRSLCMFSQTVRVVDPPRIIDHEGCCRPEQLASVGCPPHWRPASRDFPGGRRWPRTRCIGLLGELKLEWFLSTTGAR